MSDSTEIYHAEMEAARNKAMDEYFNARPQVTRGAYEESLFRAGFERAYKPPDYKNCAWWQPIETFDFDQGFAASRTVFIHTSDGRVTEGRPFITGPTRRFWVCARGSNAGDPRYKLELSPLRDTVTHWMPMPEAPRLSLDSHCEHGLPRKYCTAAHEEMNSVNEPTIKESAWDVLDAIEESFDSQIYPQQKASDFDAPDDAEYTVNITAGMWRRISRLLSSHQHPDRKPDDTYCRDCGETFK